MELYKELYAFIQPTMPGALKPVIIQAVKSAARKFCRDTEAWRAEITIASLTTVASYSFSLASYDAILLRVKSLTVNDNELTASEYAVSLDGVSLTLASYPTKAEAAGIEMEVAMLPSITAGELSYPFFDRWSEAIVAAAKAILYKQPKKPYSDQRSAMDCEIDYHSLMSKCKAENYRQSRSTDNTVDLSNALAKGGW